jgi:hypothetical protein
LIEDPMMPQGELGEAASGIENGHVVLAVGVLVIGDQVSREDAGGKGSRTRREFAP